VRSVYVSGVGVLSAAGEDFLTLGQRLEHPSPSVSERYGLPVYPVQDDPHLMGIEGDPRYRHFDRAAHFALRCARAAHDMAGWQGQRCAGVVIGSARGATSTWEAQFLQFSEGRSLRPYASPTTTAGSLSAIVANDLAVCGPVHTVSAACTSGLAAIGTAVAYLRSHLTDRMIAGGSESPLTPFTLAQMGALRIYSRSPHEGFWCRPLCERRTNTFVLGEGCALFALSRDPSPQDLARITGVGFGSEHGVGMTGMSEEGTCFQLAMRQALADLPSDDREIDLLIMHAPGTVKGDRAELTAVQRVFEDRCPVLYSTKHLTGHAFGASGPLSMVFALLALSGFMLAEMPYETVVPPGRRKLGAVRRVMVNAAGFGGSAVSVVIESN
jgi:3-oxoacyl-[acyl-carrier-protein] synthase II